MRVALAAVGFKNGDIDYNRNCMTELMREYSGRAEMIVFGETFLQGFDSLSFSYEQDKTIGITLEDARIAEICKVAKANRIAISFGFVEKEGEALFSSQVTIGADGTILDHFRRVSEGWKIPQADEHYREGDGFHDFSYLGEKFAVGLCGDLWHYENVKQMKRLQTDVVLWPVYTDFNYQEWNETIKHDYAEQAARFGKKVLYVNSVCLEQEGYEIARGGAAYFVDGQIKQEVLAGEEAVLLCETSLRGEKGMIKTKRLKVLPFENTYAEAYYRGFDADITKYQYPEPFKSLEEAKFFLQGFTEDMEKGEMLFYMILDSEEEFVGSVEVHGLQDEMPELGIWIVKEQQGKGYAYEALRAAVDYVSGRYGKKKFFYEADVRNVGSRKLLHKFQYEEKDVDKFTTESGKYLELLGAVLEV